MCVLLVKMCSSRLKRSITVTGYALFCFNSISFKILFKTYSVVFLREQDRTALLFLFFPSVLLCLRSWVWNGCLPTFPVQLYQVICWIFDELRDFVDIFLFRARSGFYIFGLCFDRRGYCFSTLDWLWERIYWEPMEAIFVHGNCNSGFSVL